ncbi:MAG: hydantoinase/oxoprolinase family protein [Methanotrichaceae archaeon]
MILGLDIGGANTKAASSDGKFAEIVYLPLWRTDLENASLDSVLRRISELEPEAVAVVMTGELADCYSSKIAGIESIRSAVKAAFHCPSYFWGVSGFDPQDPMDLAGANWSASAQLIAKDIGSCIFADMGSTTTDLIPIKEKSLAETTDFKRLINGELIYMGMLRTSLSSILHAARIQGNSVPLSPELFAITADAYLALGEIAREDYGCDTPDGAEKSRDASLRRLARDVCADLEEIGEAGAFAIAEQVQDRQQRLLMNAIQRQAKKHQLKSVVAAGIGEWIIARAAISLGMSCIRLSERYGKNISDIFPAYAVARLLAEKL